MNTCASETYIILRSSYFLCVCKMNLLYDFSDESDNEITLKRRRLFRPRLEYKFLESTLERFMLKHEKFVLLLNLLCPILERKTSRSHSLTVQQQLLITLRWLGTGTTCHAIGDLHGVSKATVCRVVKSVVTAINTALFATYVRWSENVDQVVTKFYAVGGIPLVCVQFRMESF
uniref:Putative nuclease HARBI1 n=1 Tax=Bactrocera latifrons TaxID=174628 RepID=A0A0K8VMT5_BACLA